MAGKPPRKVQDYLSRVPPRDKARDDDGSVTIWLRNAKAQGDPVALLNLWDRYEEALRRTAVDRLRGAIGRGADENDAVATAFEDFCRGLREGRFPKCDNRDDFWKIISTIVKRKALNILRDEGRRVGHRTVTESDFVGTSEGPGLDGLPDRTLTPAAVFALTEEAERLMDDLPDDDVRRIVRMRLEGHTNREIADALGAGLRTVERRMEDVRRWWGVGDADDAATPKP